MSVQAELCDLLVSAAEVIRHQSQLLAMHGISTADGSQEHTRTDVLRRISDMVGSSNDDDTRRWPA